jgi:hypothetical protein
MWWGSFTYTPSSCRGGGSLRIKIVEGDKYGKDEEFINIENNKVKGPKKIAEKENEITYTLIIFIIVFGLGVAIYLGNPQFF